MDIFNLLKSRNYSFSQAFNELAEKYNAINMAQEYNDFPCNIHLQESLLDVVKNNTHKQAPVHGVMELRQAISKLYKKEYNVDYSPETEVTISSGAIQAIYTTITSLIKEGDEVLLFEPTYGYYVRAIEERGGRPIFVKLEYPDFKIEWENVRKRITAQTKMIIINTPHNPSGTLLSSDDLVSLQRIINGTNIVILSDEVYRNFIFDTKNHTVPSQFDILRENSIIISSLGRSYNVSGWKVGYVLANAKYSNIYRNTQFYQQSSVNTPMQYTFANFIKNNILTDNYDINNIYKSKRDMFLEGLKETKFKAIPTKGTYFQLVDFSEVSDESEYEFAIRLAKEYNVLAMPLSVFYHDTVDNKILRFNFALDDDKLTRAIESLKKVK